MFHGPRFSSYPSYIGASSKITERSTLLKKETKEGKEWKREEGRKKQQEGRQAGTDENKARLRQASAPLPRQTEVA